MPLQLRLGSNGRSIYLANDVVRKPIQTFVQALSRCCAGALDVPDIEHRIK